MLTVPAQIFCALTRALLIAAARFIPGVWAVLVSRESLGITLTPWAFQSTFSAGFMLLIQFNRLCTVHLDPMLALQDDARTYGGVARFGGTFGACGQRGSTGLPAAKDRPRDLGRHCE